MKRLALTIGINNYPGAQLQGCVNDANDWADLWKKKGFDSVQTMTDSACSANAIRDALKSQVAQLKYRDTLVVCYSGHGSWVPDRNGDEADHRDEVWVGIDYQNGGLILDDELYDIFGARKFGSRIIVLSDSCFSGTVNKFVELDSPFEKGLTPAPAKAKFMPPGNFLEGQDYARALDAALAPAKGKPRPGAVLISGCAETEYSYDAHFTGPDGKMRANGAFTYFATKTFSNQPTIKQWFGAIREWLPTSEYPQSPQLQASIFQKGWKVV